MSTNRIQVNADIGGATIAGTITRTSDARQAFDVTLPAAKAGTLSTRTSDTAGTLTMGAGHGITTGIKIDIYWDGGRAYNATVGTVDGNSVPFTLASGDVMPAQDTAITASAQTSIDLAVTGDNLAAIGASCGEDCCLGFYASSTRELSVSMPGGEPWFWASGCGFTNPLAGITVTSAKASQGGTSAAVLKVGVAFDGTP